MNVKQYMLTLVPFHDTRQATRRGIRVNGSSFACLLRFSSQNQFQDLTGLNAVHARFCSHLAPCTVNYLLLLTLNGKKPIGHSMSAMDQQLDTRAIDACRQQSTVASASIKSL